MANWWDAAPVVSSTPTRGDNWWDAAPIAKKEDDNQPLIPPPMMGNGPDGGGNGGSPVAPKRQSLSDSLAGDLAQLRQGATFGFGDELSAGVATPMLMAKNALMGREVGGIGENYNKLLASDRKITGDFQKEHPALSLGLNLSGGWEAGKSLFNGVGKGFGLISNVAPKLAASKVAQGIVTGGTGGAAYGYGEGEGSTNERLKSSGKNAAIGGVLGGAVGPVIEKTLGSFVQGAKGLAPVAGKTTQALQQSKNALYNAAEQSGTVYDAGKLSNLTNQLEADLMRSGYSPDRHPFTASLLKDVQNAQNPTLPGVDSLRQAGYQAPLGAEDVFSKRISKAVSNFMEDDTNLAVGSTDQGIAINKQAREANKAFQASKLGDEIEEAVRTRARGTTAPTAATNKIRAIQKDEDAMRFLTKEQQEAINKAAETGNFQRALMMLGGLGPNRLAGAVNLGASIANPALLPLNAVGVAAQVGDRAITAGNAHNVMSQLKFNGQAQPNTFNKLGQSARSAFGLSGPTGTPPTGGMAVPNLSGAAAASPAIQPQSTPTIQRSPGVRLNARPEASVAAGALALPVVTGTGLLAQSASQSPRGPDQNPILPLPGPNNNDVTNPQDFNHDDFLDTLTNGVESRGEKNAKNPRSSALGPYQLIRSTFAGLVKKYDPETYKKGDFQALRSDPEYSKFIARKYSEENVAKLVESGLPVNKTTAYLAWFADGKTAAKLLKSPASAQADTVFSSQAMDANPFLKGKTVAQVVQWAQKKINKA